MRTSLCIALLLLAGTIGIGMMTGRGIKQVSDRYISAAEELLSMAEHEEWERAAETVQVYLDTWRKTMPRLQMLINHEDTDSVTAALITLQAGIRAKDQTTCYTACAELRENAQHLYHRDGFTLANVL